MRELEGLRQLSSKGHLLGIAGERGDGGCCWCFHWCRSRLGSLSGGRGGEVSEKISL